MAQCTLIFIALLFVLFLVGIGENLIPYKELKELYRYGKIFLYNIKPSDFLTAWTLQVTFSTILLAVGGFVINFFNEKVLGIPLSEITRKKGIWSTFIAVIISIITPVILFVFLELTPTKFSDFIVFLFILFLINLIVSLGLSYLFVCQVLNLLLKKEKLEKEIKQALEESIDKELKRGKENAINS